MIYFKSPGEFAAHLARLAATHIPEAEHDAVKRGVQIIEREVKREIGHYQRENMGPSAPWAELADATKNSRASRGFPPNNPLLVEGDLLHSIGHKVEGNEGVVGSDSEIAVYQELGTPNARHPIPPRSFLATGAFRTAHKVIDAMGGRVVWALRGLPQPNEPSENQ